MFRKIIITIISIIILLTIASAGTRQNVVSSPKDRITENQIFVYDDKIIIYLNNPEWAEFTDTKSMEPVISASANAIEIKPQSPEEIQVGDIISYKSNFSDIPVIHRIIKIGEDSAGWYAIVKGDNNPQEDPEKVRFEQIQRVVVAVIY